MTTMQEVLAEHEMENSPVIRGEGYTRCSCGYLSKGAYSRASHNRHVAAALSAAGFGLVADAKAEALEDAAGVLIPGGSYVLQNIADWLRKRAASIRATA